MILSREVRGSRGQVQTSGLQSVVAPTKCCSAQKGWGTQVHSAIQEDFLKEVGLELGFSERMGLRCCHTVDVRGTVSKAKEAKMLVLCQWSPSRPALQNRQFVESRNTGKCRRPEKPGQCTPSCFQEQN